MEKTIELFESLTRIDDGSFTGKLGRKSVSLKLENGNWIARIESGSYVYKGVADHPLLALDASLPW